MRSLQLSHLLCCLHCVLQQERPEDVPTGDLPRSMMCLVDRRLCSAVSPGTRVTAVGILSIFQGKEGEAAACFLVADAHARDLKGELLVRAPVRLPGRTVQLRSCVNMPPHHLSCWVASGGT